MSVFFQRKWLNVNELDGIATFLFVFVFFMILK